MFGRFQPVWNRAVIAAVLQVLAAVGIIAQEDVEALTVFLLALPPVVTLLAAWLTRSRVRSVASLREEGKI